MPFILHGLVLINMCSSSVCVWYMHIDFKSLWKPEAALDPLEPDLQAVLSLLTLTTEHLSSPGLFLGTGSHTAAEAGLELLNSSCLGFLRAGITKE